MRFDPLPCFSSLFLAARGAKFSAGLDEGIKRLDERQRATKSADTASWIVIYEQALGLIDRMLAELNGAAQPQPDNQPPPVSQREVYNNVLQALPQCNNAWRPRLVQQEQELAQKIERSIANLPVVGDVDPESGETVFHVPDAEMEAFARWFEDNLLGVWKDNNANLTKVRADEKIAPLLEPVQHVVRFEVSVPELRLPPTKSLASPRVPKMMPGLLSALGKTVKWGIGVLMTLSFASGFVGNISGVQVLSKGGAGGMILFGTAAVGLLVYGAVTAPKQHRQTSARIRRDAEERVRKELVQAATQQLRTTRETLGFGIQRHLEEEAARWSRTFRPSDPGIQVGAAAAARPFVSADTAAKMRGEWAEAIRTRLEELRREAAN